MDQNLGYANQVIRGAIRTNRAIRPRRLPPCEA